MAMAMELICNICLEKLQDSSGYLVLPKNITSPAKPEDLVVAPCGHVYHELCLLNYFNNIFGNCPSCGTFCSDATLLKLNPSKEAVPDFKIELEQVKEAHGILLKRVEELEEKLKAATAENKKKDIEMYQKVQNIQKDNEINLEKVGKVYKNKIKEMKGIQEKKLAEMKLQYELDLSANVEKVKHELNTNFQARIKNYEESIVSCVKNTFKSTSYNLIAKTATAPEKEHAALDSVTEMEPPVLYPEDNCKIVKL